jgi:tyrosinase
MFVRSTFFAALAILWSVVGVSCSYYSRPCADPAVRREWRAFSTEEKAEWIRAVNVRNDIPPGLKSVALLKQYS